MTAKFVTQGPFLSDIYKNSGVLFCVGGQRFEFGANELITHCKNAESTGTPITKLSDENRKLLLSPRIIDIREITDSGDKRREESGGYCYDVRPIKC